MEIASPRSGAVTAVAAPGPRTWRRIASRLLPFLFLCYLVAFLDRVNVGFARLQMSADLGLGDAAFGFGAGVFFIGYFLFEVPSNLLLQRFGARAWIARIMISWGLLSSLFMLTGRFGWGTLASRFGASDAEFTFYVLRFLLGIAEAGFFPGIILYLTYWFPDRWRGRIVALFMTSIAMSNVLGAPLSGAIMQFMDGAYGWRGWQWLFLLEGLPAVLLGMLVLRVLPDRPERAAWLSPAEQQYVQQQLQLEEALRAQAAPGTSWSAALRDLRVWLLAAAYFCGTVCLYGMNFWMPTIVQELGIAKSDYLRVGLLSMIPWGTAALTMVLWGRHSDRSGERRWHVATGLLVACAGLLLLAAVGHAPVASIVALTLVTSGTLAFFATFWSLPTAFLTSTAAAVGIAWINSVGNLGGQFGPDLLGRIRAASGGDGQVAFLALAGLAFAGAVIVLRLHGRRPPATMLS
jgi:MFS family permease